MPRRTVGSSVFVGAACCLAALAAVCGCGGDGGRPSDTAASLTAQGWERYEAADYDGAVMEFDAAITLDAGYSDAYNGLGWSYAKLDSLGPALANFELCLSKGDARPDPYAGKAPVLRDLEPAQFQNAIDAAVEALSRDSDFQFEHFKSFDWRDLRLIKAQCYYALNMYDEAVEEIEALGGSVGDPASAAEIAAEIEELENQFGG